MCSQDLTCIVICALISYHVPLCDIADKTVMGLFLTGGNSLHLVASLHLQNGKRPNLGARENQGALTQPASNRLYIIKVLRNTPSPSNKET